MLLTASFVPPQLIKLIIDSVENKVSEVDVFRAHEVVKKYTEALTLSVLAANFGEYLEDIPIFGVIKETGVDDAGLVEFQRDYFPYPLYRDQSYMFYRALGDRKLTVSFLLNPFLIFHVFFDAWHRLNRKKISGNIKGEGIVQGGIILFDRRGAPIAMYQEETGTDLPVSDLVNAVAHVRRSQESENNS
eukprot:scaffold2632_cov158-Amphora_coffeaeformis.AAC.1